MSRLTVFVVEDSATIRQNLIATLEELGPIDVVGFAEDADDAIAQLATDIPPCDLAIIDVLLRRGSGVDVLKALQARNSPLERVVLTNYASTLVRDHCLALGAARVFDKSAEVEGLLQYCETLASERR